MDPSSFDQFVQRRIGSQLFRLRHRVPKKARRRALLRNVWLVLEGDYGGQIYLSVPWQCVGPKARIGELLRAMDALSWNRLDGTDALLVRQQTVGGGMGGGRLLEGRLWLHDEFLGRDIATDGVQPIIDDLRGATNDEVRAMNWPARAVDLLGLRPQG